MQTLLLVGLGGFAGALLRYSLTLMVGMLPPMVFLSGALVVLFINNTGSFLAGILMNKVTDDNLRLIFITGFLGSFTTFSAFSREGMKLYYNKAWLLFAAFIFLNVAGSLIFYHWGYHWSKK